MTLPTTTARQTLFTEQQIREVRGTLQRAEAEAASAEAALKAAEAEFSEADRILNEPGQRRDRAWTSLIDARRRSAKLRDVLFQGKQMLARLEEELKK
jgi:hypothetical protein